MKHRILAFFMAFFYVFSSTVFFVSAEENTTQAASATEASKSSQKQSTSGIKTSSDVGCSIASETEDSLELVSEGVALMDASTGTLLYTRNPEEKFYPASITKIVTTLVALENGKLDDKLTFKGATLNAIEQDSSRVGVEADETMTLEDALYCVMLVSGNDAAAGVAEHIGGTIDDFVAMMNEKVEELGCTNTHFTNPHGLHNENHYTCAEDMALIMQAATQNEDFCRIASAKTYTVPKTNKCEARELWNHHKMLLPASEYHYDGVCEGKTGYTSDAWNTLVTTAQKDDMKLIAVVLRCQGAAAAYNDTTKLFNYGFENFHVLKPIQNFKLADAANDADLSTGELSNLEKLNPEFNQNYSILAPASVSASDISVSLVKGGEKSGIWGSIQFQYKGNKIGSANVYYDEDSDYAAIVEEDHSDKAKTVSKIPFILTAVIILLVLFIISMIISLIKRR